MPNSIATADLDNNGSLDLVVVEPANYEVFLGDGAGGFKHRIRYGVPDFSEGVVLADVDRDGKVDLLMGDTESFCSLSRGKGDGTFEYPMMTNFRLINPMLIDLDGDSLPDLAGITPDAPNNLSVSINLGNGVFALTFGVGATGTIDDYVAGDFNSDGEVDFVFTVEHPEASSANNILTLLGRGDGPSMFSVSRTVLLATCWLPDTLTLTRSLMLPAA